MKSSAFWHYRRIAGARASFRSIHRAGRAAHAGWQTGLLWLLVEPGQTG